MPIATADQYRTYRRRFLAAALIEVVTALLAGAAVIAVLGLLGDEGIYPRVVAAVTLVTVILLGQAVRGRCYRCPVCGAPLPRGPRHVAPSRFFHCRCNTCGTSFTA